MKKEKNELEIGLEQTKENDERIQNKLFVPVEIFSRNP